MKFLYKAVTKEGKSIQGVIDAKDAQEVASYLRTHDFFPVTITQKKDKNVNKLIQFFTRSKPSIQFFTRQIAMMLLSGLTFVDALRILEEQAQNEATREFTTGIVADIEGGKSFSQAIARYPELFSPVYVALIKAAETTGLLDKILFRLADNLEKQQKLKSTIKSALLYPAIVILGMVVVVIIMMLFVVPQLSVVYVSLNVALPLSTRIIVGMSNVFIVFWPFMLGFLALFIFLFRQWHKTESGKLIFDDVILRLPVFGKLIQKTILAQSTSTLSLLIGAGTLVVEALQQTAGTMGNVLYKNAILSVAEQVEKGVSVGDALGGYTVFPPILVQMAKIGEQTGKLDESFLRVSEYFEQEVDQLTKTLQTAMEPFIIVILGLGVAFLIFSIITPIYSLTSAIH